jgi:hypothetical protein
MKRFLLSFLFIAIAVISFSQNIRMYAETGGQGIKFGVLSFDNDFRHFKLLDTRELNIGLSNGIGIDGNVDKKDMDKAIPLIYDTYKELLDIYSTQGLKDEGCYFYCSSGIGVAKNINDYKTQLSAKVNHGVYVVGEDEEAKYTIAGTVPFDKIDVALVFDQGGSNSKGGYVLKEEYLIAGKKKLRLRAIPVKYDLGSKRVEVLVRKYMTSVPEDKDAELVEYVKATNKAFDSLRQDINRSFSNIDGAELRNELYLSGGAAFCITTLINPEYNSKAQLVPVKFSELKAFLLDVQDKEAFSKIKARKFADENVQKNYIKALKVYNQFQLVSATKLLITFVNALGGGEKELYFNRYGLHSMPSILIGRVERGEIKNW